MSKSLYTSLVNRLFFPLHEMLKGHTTIALSKELERSQWLSEKEIEKEQANYLKDFLSRIKVDNPFFRELINKTESQSGVIGDKSDLPRFPVLGKTEIRRNFEQYLSRNPNNPAFMSTSGSSGTPFKFAVGKDRISHDIAAKLRATRWWGVDLGDKEAVIWGSNIELTGQGALKRVRDSLFRSRLFPAQHLDNDGLKALFNQLNEFQPAMFYGYPSILTLLANYVLNNGLVYNKGQLKVIFCTAEKLYPHQREVIEKVFGAPTANGYGSRDAGFIAHECPEGGLHISEEHIIAEVLDDNGNPCEPGKIGQLIITHLATQDFPMVRYNTGDLAILSDEKCACGRGLRCFTEVVGRSNDVLTATNGSSVHGAYIGNIIREDSAVSNFQLTQQERDLFELKLVAYPNCKIDETSMNAKLLNVFGSDARIESEILDTISAEKTGKYKYIINNYQAS